MGEKGESGFFPASMIPVSNEKSRVPSRQDFEALFESVKFKRFFPFLVVIRVIRVEPIALGIDIAIGDFRQLRGLNQELLLGDETRNEIDFGFVQMELATVEIAVHIGVREEDFRGAALDDYVEDVRTLEFVERLHREHDCGVVFPPGFECLDDVSLDGRVLQKYPRLVDEERLEKGGSLTVGYNRIGAMQDVEEQRFEKFRVLAHALEVEALEAGERNRVLCVVEEESELAATGPFGEAVRNVMPECVCQHAQRAECRVHRIQVFDLVKEFAFGGRVEF